jgi:hypothetical protein
MVRHLVRKQDIILAQSNDAGWLNSGIFCKQMKSRIMYIELKTHSGGHN